MFAVVNFPIIVFDNYVQIEDCRTRYNGDADHHQRRKKFSFPARLICGDCFEVIAVLIASFFGIPIISCIYSMILFYADIRCAWTEFWKMMHLLIFAVVR